MGITKTDLFTEEQNELANMAKALAHPARVAILEYLLKAQQCINSDLVDELGLAQPTVSQHLKELKALGIIEGTVEGTSMCYCINRAGWEKIMTRVFPSRGLSASAVPRTSLRDAPLERIVLRVALSHRSISRKCLTSAIFCTSVG